ncbi:MAG: SIS domain-containing protein [Armatimonadota bacterium]|nr:SIS domain-containing protein [Armatimonadota bacterium]
MGAVKEYLTQLVKVIESLPEEKVQDFVDTIAEAYNNDRQVVFLGNGGSAATASHFACDMQKGIGAAGPKRFKAMALTDNVPVITAWANDTDYSRIFVGQIDTWVNPGDLVIAISGSGNSPNVIEAVELANKKGAITYGLTGFDGGRLAKIAKKSIVVHSNNMQQIEDVHIVLDHLVYTCLKQIIGH